VQTIVITHTSRHNLLTCILKSTTEGCLHARQQTSSSELSRQLRVMPPRLMHAERLS
jgi:hypothetical protein